MTDDIRAVLLSFMSIISALAAVLYSVQPGDHRTTIAIHFLTVVVALGFSALIQMDRKL